MTLRRKEDEIDKELFISGFSNESLGENECSEGELNVSDLSSEDGKQDELLTETSDRHSEKISLNEKLESMNIASAENDGITEELDCEDDRTVDNFSVTSSIAPEVIHSRLKKSLKKRTVAVTRHRKLAKGEASAVTRKRKENKNIIKEYSSPSIWE